MISNYCRKTKELFTRPSDFYGEVLQQPDLKGAARYTALTGVFVALGLALRELLLNGSPSLVALVTALLLLLMPAVMLAGVYAWTGFMRLCAGLLDESLPDLPLRLVVAYSVAGFLTLGLGFTLGKWLSLVFLIFQVLGVERMLKCSRWTAVVFVMLPFSIVGVVILLFTLMFKVF